MGSLALVDIVTPYVLGGAAIGDPLHELVSALFVPEIDTAVDDAGVTIWGIARFGADITANPPGFTAPDSRDRRRHRRGHAAAPDVTPTGADKPIGVEPRRVITAWTATTERDLKERSRPIDDARLGRIRGTP